MTAAHILPVRIYYEDTDAGGVVYHASYIRFCERGRTEMLRAMGYEHHKLFTEKGIGFVVVSLHIDYRRPARLDDLLQVETSVERVGGASFDLRQVITRDGAVMAEVKLTLVVVDRRLKAVRLPQDLRDVLQQ